MLIETRHEYDYCISRGIEPLADARFELPIALRKSIQKEKFGGNNAQGNEKFYKFCIRHLPHQCEECLKPIEHPTAVNVSHILSRGAHPEMAHDIRNVNFLCFEHHAKWENGDRKSMRIWAKNERTIEKLKHEYL